VIIYFLYFWLFFSLSPTSSSDEPLTLQKALQLASLREHSVKSGNSPQSVKIQSDCIRLSKLNTLDGLGLVGGSSIQSAEYIELMSRSDGAAVERGDATETEECTIAAYVDLLKGQIQMRILAQQPLDAEDQVRIQSQRVRKEIDDSTSITHARLLAAKVEFWKARLHESENASRQALAVLTGLPEEKIGSIARYLPANEFGASREKPSSVIAIWTALRDVAQLEYDVARENRMKFEVRGVVGKSKLPELVEARFDEQEHALWLLEIHFALLKLRLIEAVRDNRPGPGIAASNVESKSRADDAEASQNLAGNQIAEPNILMLTPEISSLVVGQPKKFTLTEISADHTAKDVTKLARWSCSDSVDSIVSSDGLFTSFASGPIIVSAEFENISKAVQLQISVDDWSPWGTR
jgi:hypothetical protein